ncbi:MAG TPA: hypothetical protein VHY83_07865 [Solirubrobacteraceae bacterium]|nr:hypothetical protein [Solirubrobacteraceae bacterium]
MTCEVALEAAHRLDAALALGSQHVVEDCGRIPSLSNWLRYIRPELWMNRRRRLARELEPPVNLTAAPSAGTEADRA